MTAEADGPFEQRDPLLRKPRRADADGDTDPITVPASLRGPFADATINSSELVTDISLATELGERDFDQNGRFVAAWGDWLFWSDSRWMRAPYPVSRARVRNFLKWKSGQIRIDHIGENGGKVDRACKALESHATVTAVEQMARSNLASIATPEQFDSGRLLLGTPGGTVDLRTGRLRQARRSDYLTKGTAVAPAAPGTTPHAWLGFLKSAFPGPDGTGDLEMIGFLQRLAGYALTGETTEHKLFFCYGRGRNGKGIFTNTLQSIWGDYAKSVSSNILVVQYGQQHPTGLAQLQGLRLVTASEIKKGSTWDEEILKSLTGGDSISARYMRQDFFEFTPQLTLIISGNSKPRFRSIGTSMRERFILIPFGQEFSDENGRRDPDLAAKLRAEWPAILRWSIDGAVAWSKVGLGVPPAVRDASETYLVEEDSVAGFVLDHLEPAPGHRLSTAAVYVRFRVWQERQGERSLWSQKAMASALVEDAGLEMQRVRPSGGGEKTNCIVGYRLKPQEALL